MFIDNGDNTWTVRFYFNGVPDDVNYVTVDRWLPAAWNTDHGRNELVYAGWGWDIANANNALWLPLAEKAYAQWHETGGAGLSFAYNSYGAIDSTGWIKHVLDCVDVGYMTNVPENEDVLIAAMLNHNPVTIQRGGHLYTVVGYDSNTHLFDIYNAYFLTGHSNVDWQDISRDWAGFHVAYT